jgi:glutathione synthase/RimK-type ligase-like ATP-grasp enzyme
VRAVPLALAYLKALDAAGAHVVNGAPAFALELSKTAQCALLTRLGLRTPRSVAFNDVDALAALLQDDGSWRWPALLKPEQGGSGARIHRVGSLDEVRATLKARDLWQPDGLLLLQEFIEHDVERGIVRMEFIGGELLYAMRVVSHGRFNLCPSETCNPAEGAEGACEIETSAAPAVEFHAFPEVPRAAVDAGRRILDAGRIDIGGIEYLESSDGDRVFYDVNANSNLRPAIAREYGFDPFERVVDYLLSKRS